MEVNNTSLRQEQGFAREAGPEEERRRERRQDELRNSESPLNPGVEGTGLLPQPAIENVVDELQRRSPRPAPPQATTPFPARLYILKPTSVRGGGKHPAGNVRSPAQAGTTNRDSGQVDGGQEPSQPHNMLGDTADAAPVEQPQSVREGVGASRTNQPLAGENGEQVEHPA